MDKKIEISVIVPIYNAEKFIIRCVTSILQQTFTDFELLLINDGSTDSSGSICDNLAQKDERIRVIHKENSGVSDTRNMGLKEAKGKYISFVDSDDYIDNNDRIALANMNFEAKYNNSDEVKNKLLHRYYTDKHEGLYPLWNKLIRIDLYVKNNIWFDIGRKRGEDAWFVFQCLKHANKVVCLSKGYYYYYQSYDSIMHQIFLDQYEQWVRNRKELLFENQELKFDIDYSLFYREFLYKVCVYCRELAKKGEINSIKTILKDTLYKEALSYQKDLPIHVKMLGQLAMKGNVNLLIILYKLWALV